MLGEEVASVQSQIKTIQVKYDELVNLASNDQGRAELEKRLKQQESLYAELQDKSSSQQAELERVKREKQLLEARQLKVLELGRNELEKMYLEYSEQWAGGWAELPIGTPTNETAVAQGDAGSSAKGGKSVEKYCKRCEDSESLQLDRLQKAVDAEVARQKEAVDACKSVPKAVRTVALGNPDRHFFLRRVEVREGG